jgi:large subunit ribosomal protein L15e
MDKPTNIARARELGYKAKEGVLIARVRVKRGSSKREANAGGRKPSKSGRFFTRAKSLQAIAEERAVRKFSNCEVLNSYFTGSSGADKFFEVILLDRSRPSLANDPEYSRVLAQRNRASRGLTSSGRRHRGLSRKGFGTYSNRPSGRSNIRQQR